MAHTLSHYRTKLAEKGFSEIVAGRLRWYKQAFQMNNWFVGRMVELTGNRINLDGVSLSVDNPLVKTAHKGSIYFGIYEISERRLSKLFIDRSLPIIEIGASIGGVSCTTNRLLLDTSKHVVLECNPLVLPTLHKNRMLNRCKFAIEPIALAYGSETISFTIDTEHFMLGNVSSENGKKITVKTTSLAKLLYKYSFNQINLVSDSEGCEIDMVANEPTILRDRVKSIIVETHPQLRGEKATNEMIASLVALGFDIKDQGENTLAMINKNI